jgi:hypothetical protein
LSETDGQSIEGYEPETLDLILAEAANVIRASGFAAEHIVIIGGLVPNLLVPVVDPGGRPHIGTTDIDLCLSVALVEGETEEYERLEAVLRSLDFEISDVSFRWIRRSGLKIVVEFFCSAAEDRPAGRAFRPNLQDNPVAKQNLGGRLSALALNAGELLATDLEHVTRQVVLPDGKGEIQFEFRVTGPIAFLVAKLDALVQRDKPKDAYDIVWLIENWPGGPAAAATSFAQRSAFNDVTVASLRRLGEVFGNVNQVGPASYARFLSSDTPELDKRQSVGAVEEFLVALNAESGVGSTKEKS